MMMFWGLQVAWSQVHHQASVSGITNPGKTRVLGPRIIASATYITLHGPRSAQRHRGTFAAMITHPLAALQCRLPPAAECRRNGCVPALPSPDGSSCASC
jgi:hypothetical protein